MNRDFQRLLAVCVALAALTLAVYWPVLGSGFVDYDDFDYVTKNAYVQAGFTRASFAWVWTSEVARNWHPITMLSHMADCQLYGMKPAGHHLTNLLLHIANVLLLFLLLRRLTASIWRSAFVAALFAVHPLHVESVAWIAERKDVLSTFFFLLTLFAYAKYVAIGRSREVAVEKPRGKNAKPGASQSPGGNANPWPFYGLALGFFLLGLMSKPMLVTTPFVLWLLDFWPLGRIAFGRRTPRVVWLDKLPFLALSAVSSVITFLVQQKGGAVLAVTNLSVANRAANAVISYVRYLGKMAWPVDLAPLYLKHGAWPLWGAALAGLGLIILSVAAVRQARVRPFFPVGWFWYLGTLVPVIGIVQVGMQSMADRYTYIPLIGIFIIIAWGAAELMVNWSIPKIPVAVSAGVILITCAVVARMQIRHWHDSEALFHRMIAVTPGNYIAYYNLANGYSRHDRLEEAVRAYRAALTAEPNYAEAHNNLGTVLLRQGKYEDAIAEHLAAARLMPQFLYYFNLANAYTTAGQLTNAIATYREALKLDPNSSDAHHNFALALQSAGRAAEAIAEFRLALRLRSDYESAEFHLANRLADAGQIDEAITHYVAAQRLDPNRAETANGLGICYAMQGKFAEAERQFREAIRIRPGFPGAESNLGNALGAQNKIDEAIPHYQKALQVDTNDFQTHFNLGVSLLHSGRRAEAKEHFAEALRIHPDYPAARDALKSLEAGR